MSEENNKPEDDLDEDQIEDLEDNESEDDSTEEDDSIDLTGLTGAALAAAVAANKKKATKKKKPVKGKTRTLKSKVPAGTVDVNAEIDKLQNLTDKNTVWTIAGYSFTPAKLMILGTILSTGLGGLYGSFEVYKDYQDMKMKIEKYVAPDLSEIYKKIEISEQNSEKSVQYTQDIKNDLKQDIRRLETIVDQVERTSKQSNRESEQEVRQIRQQNEQEIRSLKKEIDTKIQKALDNPLAK